MTPPEWCNIADLFLTERVREGRGERVALRLADRQLSYAEVNRLASRFGHALLGLGVRQEERVLLALPDSAEYAGALFGILKIGAVAVMINPGLTADGLAAMAELSRARVAVVAPGVAPPVPHLLEAEPGTWLDRPDELETARTHRDHPAI